MKPALLALLILAASPVSGQTPVPIPTPTPAPVPVPAKPAPVVSVAVPVGPLYAGDLVIFDGSASVGDQVDWEMISPPDVSTFSIDSNGLSVAFANKTPGKYVFRVEAESVIDGKIVKKKKRVEFTLISPVPDPAPAPTPGPTPAPPVPPVPPVPPAPAVTGPLHAVLVFDVDEPSTAGLRVSTVKADLAAMNTKWYVAPSAGTTAAMFSAYTTADGLPTVYLMDDSGKIIDRVKAPTTKDQVIAKVKQLRGVN